MNLLAVDIGNTRIKAGLFLDEVLDSVNVFYSLNELTDYIFLIKNVKHIAVSSVVPALTEELTSALKERADIIPFIITSDSRFSFSLNYDTPDSLGIDRICSCEGALECIKQNKKEFNKDYFIVTTALGTATTVNIVKNGTEFIGGAIAPGLFTMADSLSDNTARLPNVEFTSYEGVIGNNPVKAIESGIINSTLGLYYMVFENLYSQYSAQDIFFFITGGNAKYITPHLKLNYTHIDELVLLGIKAVFEKNKNDD
jgi:type III pantothenate kinase